MNEFVILCEEGIVSIGGSFKTPGPVGGNFNIGGVPDLSPKSVVGASVIEYL